MAIAVRVEADGRLLIQPAGEIDADSAHQVRDIVTTSLAATVPPKVTAITVDLARVSFIDSVGIGALVGCYHAAAASGVPLNVVNPTRNVHRILYISGLLGLFGAPAHLPEGEELHHLVR